MKSHSEEKESEYVKVNAARCKDCGDILVSLDVHDFVSCRCPSDHIFIDGGSNQGYIRRGGNPKKFVEVNLYLKKDI